MSARLAVFGLLGLLVVASPASAGPPFVTDDPVPTDTGKWEIYAFASASHVPGDTSGSTGLDLNYGPVKDVQLTATLPLDYSSNQALRAGDVELGMKVRLLHQTDVGVDVAIFPRIILPTSAGSRRADILLPLWVEHDWKQWALFGGGGYVIHGGAGNRNYWLASAAVTRSLGERLTLGAEVYRQGPDSIGARGFTGANVGAIYRLSRHWSLLASGGPGLSNAREGGQYSAYAATRLEF